MVGAARRCGVWDQWGKGEQGQYPCRARPQTQAEPLVLEPLETPALGPERKLRGCSPVGLSLAQPLQT